MLVTVGFIVEFNRPDTSLAFLRKIPQIARLGELFQTEGGTNRIRMLIWTGASELTGWQRPIVLEEKKEDNLHPLRFLIGYGPESMDKVFDRFRPTELGRRMMTVDRSHNGTFDTLVTRGWLGLFAKHLVLINLFLLGLRRLGWMAKKRDLLLFVGLWVGLGGSGALLLTTILMSDFQGICCNTGKLGSAHDRGQTGFNFFQNSSYSLVRLGLR